MSRKIQLASIAIIVILILFYINNNREQRGNKMDNINAMYPDIGDISQYKNIGEMIDSGTAQENIWYWIDGRKMNREASIYYPAFPLSSTKDALVIPSDMYFSNYKRVDGYPCTAMMLKRMPTLEGDKMLMYKEVSVLHWDKEIIPDDSVAKAINASSLAEGVHYFKTDQECRLAIDQNGKPIVLQPEAVAFLRCYYRVNVAIQPDATRTVTYKRVRPVVGRYIIYEYYPSGLMKRKTIVEETGLNKPSQLEKTGYVDRYAEDRDKFMEYTIYDRPFNDKGMEQTTPAESQVNTVLTDRSSPLWVQNILHD